MSLSRRFVVSLLLLALVVSVGTVGYRLLLHAPWLDGLYMTVITLSTVGYGEVVPGLAGSVKGRIFTMGLILVGMGLLLYVLSSTTAFFVEGELTNLIRRRKMEKAIARLRDHLIVCGVGSTGQHVVEELLAIKENFVAIDASQAHLDRLLAHREFLYIHGDATSDEVMIKAGIERARGVLAVLSNDKDNLFVTITARQLNPSVRIVSRGSEHGIRERLVRAGANAVVFPNHIGGLRIAAEMVRPRVVGFLDGMLRPGGETWRIEEVAVAAGSPVVGQTLGSLRIGERLGLPILALVEGEDRHTRYYPSPDMVIHAGASLVVLAEKDHIERLRQLVARG